MGFTLCLYLAVLPAGLFLWGEGEGVLSSSLIKVLLSAWYFFKKIWMLVVGEMVFYFVSFLVFLLFLFLKMRRYYYFNLTIKEVLVVMALVFCLVYLKWLTETTEVKINSCEGRRKNLKEGHERAWILDIKKLSETSAAASSKEAAWSPIRSD